MIDFQTMMRNAPNPYMALDRDYRFIWANAAYERATMRSFAEIEGQNLFEAFPPPSESAGRQLRESIGRAFQTGEADELAFIEYPIRSADGDMATVFWSATHTPFRNDAGEVAYVLQHTVDVTELETLRRRRDESGVIERARAVEQRVLDLSAEASRLRSLVEQAPGFVVVVSGPEHRFVLANAAYRRFVGDRAILGRPVAEALPEVVEQGFVALLDEVVASAKPYIGRREKLILVDQSSGLPLQLYVEFIFQPIMGHEKNVTGIFVQGHDVTEQVEAEERQRLLINELNHRVKNTLAVVQGLAQQSFGNDSGGRFNAFSARLATLAAAHNLLTDAVWEAADLHSLVTSSLEATAGLEVARCTLSGPPVTLPPELAVTMAMIVHELSTNAIKYGALSTGTGKVDVTWSAVPSGEATELALVWNETGGPRVEAPTRAGFGTRLIRRGLGGQGRAELDYRPVGLQCRIEATL